MNNNKKNEKEVYIISEANFKDYLRVQKAGKYNMYSMLAVSATGLSVEIYQTIQKEYEQLMIVYDEAYKEIIKEKSK